MNQHLDDPIPPFDDAAHEREWLAQERAMRRERLRLDPAGDDTRSRRYRLIARALREPLPDALPADFARQVAARVATAPSRQTAPGSRVEPALLLVLGGALALAAGIVTTIYGHAWLQPFGEILSTFHPTTSDPLLALGGCLAASWLLGRWQWPLRTTPPAA